MRVITKDKVREIGRSGKSVRRIGRHKKEVPAKKETQNSHLKAIRQLLGELLSREIPAPKVEVKMPEKVSIHPGFDVIRGKDGFISEIVAKEQ